MDSALLNLYSYMYSVIWTHGPYWTLDGYSLTVYYLYVCILLIWAASLALLVTPAARCIHQSIFHCRARLLLTHWILLYSSVHPRLILWVNPLVLPPSPVVETDREDSLLPTMLFLQVTNLISGPQNTHVNGHSLGN